MSILSNAVAAILDRKAGYEVAEGYYNGTVGETFASSDFPRSLRLNGSKYTVNFTRVIVDAVADRLELANVVATTQEAQRKIGRIFEQPEFQLEANEIHRRALEYGDCYAIVWPDEEGNLYIDYNSPKTTTVVYDAENPRVKSYAAKMWEVPGRNVFGNPVNIIRLNLYFADRIEKYRKEGNVTGGNGLGQPDPYSHYQLETGLNAQDTGWTLIDTLENPFGEVPVFHFRTHRPYGRPEHYDAYSLQQMCNKTLITHMFTMDYQGAPQRYALSNFGNDAEFEDFNEGDTDRENLGALQNGPGELWYLKGVNQVGEFKPADPDNFLKPVREFLKSMAAVTSTPVHFFDRGASGFSGEALRAAEGPLMKKIADRQQAFGATWREIFKFILKVEGSPVDVTVKWQSPENLDGLDVWDVMLKKINAGLSHRQALREGGYDEQLIEKIMAERAEEAQTLFYVRNRGTLDRKPQTRVAPESRELNEATTTETNGE